MYERQLLRELEALRVDVSNAAKKVIPTATAVPKPTIVPPLEDDVGRPHPEPAPTAPLANGFHQPSLSQPPHTAGIQNGFVPHKLPVQAPNPVNPSIPSPSPFPQTPVRSQDPLSASSFRSFSSSMRTPASPSPSQQFGRQSAPPQSPGAGPSSAASPVPSVVQKQAADEPPLGGRFVDGTKSMFITKTSSGPRPSPLSLSSSTSNIQTPDPSSGSSAPFDPLRSDSYPSVSSPLNDSTAHGVARQQRPQDIDPLASIKPHQMSSSMRVQPTRPRLDAREAASKLANMF